MPLTRRAVLRAGAAAAVAALTGCATGRYRGPEREIRIAGGQPGGFYLEVAQLLVRAITAAEPRLRCSALDTDGSVENVDLIRDGRADIGVCQSDVSIAAVDGSDPFTDAVPVRGIGRMYQDYLQLVVLEDSPLRSIDDLAGRTVSLGAAGSGTAIVGRRLRTAAGVRIVEKLEPLDEAVASLRARRVDAMLWSGGVPTPVLDELDHEVGIRLLPLVAVLDKLHADYGTAYQQVTIPAGGYGDPEIPTIGVANLLLCDRDLPDDVVAAVTGLLVERADQLIPPQVLGAQFLDRRALINLLGIPIHPGAAFTYRQLHG